jgi:hypothetical protein
MNEQLEAAKFAIAAKSSCLETTLHKLFSIICKDVEVLYRLDEMVNSARSRTSISGEIKDCLAAIQQELAEL